MRVVAWNAQWASGERGQRVRRVVSDVSADVVVLSEGSASLLPSSGEVVDGGNDWGYPVEPPDRRKILLWTSTSWTDVDDRGDDRLPPGRFVSAITDTSISPVRVVAVCVPWARAHVSTGRRDRRPWEDHVQFLDGLRTFLAAPFDTPTIVAGDLNQRIPRTGQPVEVVAALERALDGFTMVTAGEVDGRRLIDHVAVRGLVPAGPPSVVDRLVGGVAVSDHDGVIVDLELG